MSIVVTVASDALPYLYGSGSVLEHKDMDTERVIVTTPDGHPGLCWAFRGGGEERQIRLGNWRLVLHDPDDPEVSAAGMARASRALRKANFEQWEDWHEFWVERGGDAETAEAAEALREVIEHVAGER